MASFAVKATIGGLLAVIFAGCASPPDDLYYWGSYEDALYDMYINPGNASLTDQILRMEEQIRQTDAKGKAVPPGFYAHLGYLYVNDGDYDAAAIHFQMEKEHFPESTDFIDGILQRMKK
jgi:hypothetical protein